MHGGEAESSAASWTACPTQCFLLNVLTLNSFIERCPPHLQIHTGFLAGDFNVDRSVDFADFLLLSSNFSASRELTSVPEPASVWMISIA